MAAVTFWPEDSLIILTSWLFWTGANLHATTVRHLLESVENFSFIDIDLSMATTALPSTMRLVSHHLLKYLKKIIFARLEMK